MTAPRHKPVEASLKRFGCLPPLGLCCGNQKSIFNRTSGTKAPSRESVSAACPITIAG